MNTEMLRNLLYEHRNSPDLLLEAFKLGCVHERSAAKQRAKINQRKPLDNTSKNVIRCTQTMRKGEVMTTVMKQKRMLSNATSNYARSCETFLEMVEEVLTRDELTKLIEKRPSLWGRFSNWLTKLP